MARGTDWLAYVNQAHTDAELARLRQSVRQGVPFGGEVWVKKTAAALGLEFTMRSRGRPRGGGQPAARAAEGLFGEQ